MVKFVMTMLWIPFVSAQSVAMNVVISPQTCLEQGHGHKEREVVACSGHYSKWNSYADGQWSSALSQSRRQTERRSLEFYTNMSISVHLAIPSSQWQKTLVLWTPCFCTRAAQKDNKLLCVWWNHTPGLSHKRQTTLLPHGCTHSCCCSVQGCTSLSWCW